ncbi:MAG: alpha/beta hydrolase [Leptolyngbya sp.]|nr:alpha/beta hydrolase [Candidatus Melainabacteria bacterium]
MSGIVFVLDGAGAAGFTPKVLRKSLAVLPYEVNHFYWATGYGLISDLTDRKNIEKKALELSAAITEYRQNNENGRVFVIAKSAGTMVALRALAQVEAHAVERVVLMSPAVSKDFVLVDALKAVKNEMVSFWSPIDLFFLGLGTSVFGTADGIRGKGAGVCGFQLPADLSASEDYSKLRQIKWTPSMARCGHFGDHWGNSMPPFVDRYIVPLFLENSQT